MSQPSDDWSLLDICWRDLLEKDDRTSPAEYPDMVLISREELRDLMGLAHDEGLGLGKMEGRRET